MQGGRSKGEVARGKGRTQRKMKIKRRGRKKRKLKDNRVGGKEGGEDRRNTR